MKDNGFRIFQKPVVACKSAVETAIVGPESTVLLHTKTTREPIVARSTLEGRHVDELLGWTELNFETTAEAMRWILTEIKASQVLV